MQRLCAAENLQHSERRASGGGEWRAGRGALGWRGAGAGRCGTRSRAPAPITRVPGLPRQQQCTSRPNKVSNVENEQAVWCQSQSARDPDTARSMRSSLYLVALCALVAARAAPAPDAAPDAAPEPAPQPAAAAAADDRPEIIEIIAPAASAQETLATLNLGAPGSELSERNKRTIGILRQLFPSLTQIIEQKVQQLTSMVLQTFGPVVLRLFLGNRNGGGNTGGGTVELDDDDDDDDDDDEPASSTSSAGPSSTSSTSAPLTSAPSTRRRRALFFLPNALAEENQLLSGAESQQAEVRVAFGEGQADQQVAASDDQQTAAQTNAASIDEITLDDADNSEENRNKRFLSFGGSAGAGASGGGSGNFLFDIVRLVAGSSSGSSSGDAGASADGDDAGAAKGDNLTEGVPGPITRLFIIANRGIANLIQDLILRIAQTSERIVNFKARLITSII
ncbi:uncharacterized protein LOC118281890 isoform X2 [Spodoptera frugiperda]|uniref:Uncharacterized protein LOC118281890 isoform X2 n=1 Tax=Spodoptera frugiperda TaxID=7108 RepID=A0A9R0ET25_SPOFR|nr:uncharacterized protein LOC118281890 isoform X2 [Spodoptera frugiperda]